MSELGPFQQAAARSLAEEPGGAIEWPGIWLIRVAMFTFALALAVVTCGVTLHWTFALVKRWRKFDREVCRRRRELEIAGKVAAAESRAIKAAAAELARLRVMK